MISRLWRGWTTEENADAYEALLRSEILPGIDRVPGFRGAYLLRRTVRNVPSGTHVVEFVTITLFDDMDAVRAFAGADETAAVVPAVARRLLSRFDERSVHFETVLTPEDLTLAARERPPER
jgi:heme-degrading monooxygenase HmoA